MVSPFSFETAPTQEVVTSHWDRGCPIVTIQCTTYNHSQYIEQALLGFLNQRSRYPFEILVYDDASTDGTQEIIRCYASLYPAIITPILQNTNQYKKPIGQREKRFPKSVVNGRYIAKCEGDDYWISPDKIEKQIEALESQPNALFSGTQCYVLACGDADVGAKHPAFTYEQMAQKSWLSLYKYGVFMKYLTRVAPLETYEAFSCELGRIEDRHNWPAEIRRPGTDALFFGYCMMRSRERSVLPAYIDEAMGVYRVHSGGVFSGETVRWHARLRHVWTRKKLYQLSNTSFDKTFNLTYYAKAVAAFLTEKNAPAAFKKKCLSDFWDTLTT